MLQWNAAIIAYAIVFLFLALPALMSSRSEGTKTFLIALAPFLSVVISIVGFMLMREQQTLAAINLIVVAVGVAGLIADSWGDVAKTLKGEAINDDDEPMSAGMLIIGVVIVALTFGPGFLLGVLWYTFSR